MSEKIIKLVMGKRGCGKSFLVKQLIKNIRRLFVYDSMGEYTDGVVVEDMAELRKFWSKVYRGHFRIIYRPTDAESEFEPICQLIWVCGYMTLVAEEVQTFCNTRSICKDFKAIVAKGRHRDITLIGVTQRPAEISKLLTSQAKEICIFNTTEPNDLQYFKDSFGSELVEKIGQLQQYEYVFWKDGVKELMVSKAKLEEKT